MAYFNDFILKTEFDPLPQQLGHLDKKVVPPEKQKAMLTCQEQWRSPPKLDVDIFGHFWTFLVFRHFCFIDIFGFWTFLDIFGHFWTFFDIFRP